ncbi:hypothetical protein CEK26_012241 [Fusarium fujikuroi]|uniref:Uncharacterized protein n=1 Tax=Fusarium fujikuroi TaxID=5127 RepID=A0A5Q3DN89_FUSFU|nr:hypothetical protein CEK27_012253 [Fusarium fujikuroi]QGI85497.1 hypothetical protein CEK25_012226 [Fusarium fujikuroi]QGI99172.1 hypothetical protein CEK26_012241 [Fusarium fujikuroi]VTT64944.1 unnamed protein product [Fusarium fujikuroi]VTT78810.1 unnamed protein product [Fusarium fujikuroi]
MKTELYRQATATSFIHELYSTITTLKDIKASYILALSAPLLALAAPTPANSQLAKKAEAESFFLQTDVGWFDGGDKKRAISEKRSTKKRAPVDVDVDAESFFLQTDVGWFDGGDKKRASI